MIDLTCICRILSKPMIDLQDTWGFYQSQWLTYKTYRDLFKTNDWSTEHMGIWSKPMTDLQDTWGFGQNQWSIYRAYAGHGQTNNRSMGHMQDMVKTNDWFTGHLEDIVKTNDWSTGHMGILSKTMIDLPDTCGFGQNQWSIYRTYEENYQKQWLITRHMWIWSKTMINLQDSKEKMIKTK